MDTAPAWGPHPLAGQSFGKLRADHESTTQFNTGRSRRHHCRDRGQATELRGSRDPRHTELCRAVQFPGQQLLSYFTHGVTLAYRTFGTGPVPLLAFHGFGRTGEDFRILEEPLGELCTIYAFDLHFHGDSPAYPARADIPFTPRELATYYAAFIDGLGAEKACVLGYSFGGRTVLSILEQIPERVEQAFLAAPDGLKTLPWYRGLAATGIGRWMYQRFVEHPEHIHTLVNVLKDTHLMNERMHRFLIGQSDTLEKRRLIHDVWLSYRKIEPSLKQVAANSRRHAIPIHLFFGRSDRVIPAKLGRNLQKYAPENIGLDLLPFGHVLVTKELGDAIAAILKGTGK